MDILCRGRKANGEACTLSATGQHGFCWAHDPANAERRRRIASRGGKGRATREVTRLKDDIKVLISEVRGGELDRSDAAVMIQGYRALMGYLELERKVTELDDLLRRLDALERGRAKAG